MGLRSDAASPAIQLTFGTGDHHRPRQGRIVRMFPASDSTATVCDWAIASVTDGENIKTLAACLWSGNADTINVMMAVASGLS